MASSTSSLAKVFGPGRQSLSGGRVLLVGAIGCFVAVALLEQRLWQLLADINHACHEIQQMVPMSGQQFGRGYDFSTDTVQQVQKMWFNTADAIAVLNQRQQLKRPGQWSEMRRDVMQLSSGSGADMTLENSPGQCLPDSELALCSITSDGQP